MLHAALGGLVFTQENAQHAGLAATVGPHDADAFAFGEPQREAREQAPARDIHRQIFGFEDHPPAASVIELEGRASIFGGSVLGKRGLGPLDPSLLLGRPRLGRLAQPLELALEESLAVALHPLCVGCPQGLGLEVHAPTSVVAVDLALFDLERAGDDAVEQVPVVGHHQQCPAVPLDQPLLEPLDRRDVEVVGGLIENRKLRLRDEDSCQRDPALFPAAHVRDLGVVLCDAEVGQHARRFVAQVPASEVLHFARRIGLGLQQCVEVSGGLLQLG